MRPWLDIIEQPSKTLSRVVVNTGDSALFLILNVTCLLERNPTRKGDLIMSSLRRRIAYIGTCFCSYILWVITVFLPTFYILVECDGNYKHCDGCVIWLIFGENIIKMSILLMFEATWSKVVLWIHGIFLLRISRKVL